MIVLYFPSVEVLASASSIILNKSNDKGPPCPTHNHREKVLIIYH